MAGTAAPSRKRPSALILAILLAASTAAILSTDLYAPTLPHLPEYFGTDAATVQLTMALNVASLALSLLVWGPLSDRYGRRAIFLVGMGVFLASAVAAALAPTIEALLAARIVMGAAAGVEAVVVLAMISDLWEEEDSARVFALYGMVMAVAPAAGPVIGGFVYEFAGWRANFALLAGVIALGWAAGAWRLPESLPDEARVALRLSTVTLGYVRLLRLRAFVGLCVTMGLALGSIFAYITEAPFVLIDRHGVETRHYGLYQAAIVTAFFFGSLAANRTVARYGILRLYGAGIWLVGLSGALVVVVVAAGETPVTLSAAMAVFAFALGPIFATGQVLAFGQAGAQGRGLSAAVISFFQMGGAALGSLLISLLHDGTAWPIAWIMGGAAAMTVAAGLVAVRDVRAAALARRVPAG